MNLYRKSPACMHTRWSSFENPSAGKGCGAKENRGAKGHAFDRLKAGETFTLLDVKGSGTVRRLWFTLGDRSPVGLRSLRLEMFWDGSEKPAVSVPFGDFFGWILGRGIAFENELFASPEGKSFVCMIPMPFRTGARITVTNEGEKDSQHFFYDIDITQGDPHDEDVLYFHAAWRRERYTELGKDFRILPRVKGAGHFIGSHVGVILRPGNRGWWGEGEIKVWLDGDREDPTLVGTGTEDYISTAWGQGVFAGRYTGCPMCDNENGFYSFYRYHIPDPIIFHEDCEVAMQQIGGTMKGEVISLLKEGQPVRPVTLDCNAGQPFLNFLEGDDEVDLEDPSIPDGWVNFYRCDDWCAVSFFYIDKPGGVADALPCVEKRVEGIVIEPSEKADKSEG